MYIDPSLNVNGENHRYQIHSLEIIQLVLQI